MTNPKNGLIAGALALVAVIGGAAWYQSEHKSPASANLYNASGPGGQLAESNGPLNNPNFNNGQPASYNSGYQSSNTGSAGDSRFLADRYNPGREVAPNPYEVNRSDRESGYGQSGQYSNGSYQTANANSGYVSNDGYNAPANYGSGQYVQSIRRPVRVYYPPAQNIVRRETVYDQRAPRRVYNNDYVEHTTVYDRRHHRSTKKSVAIVAGTAAGGALIGGLAGGGKGAALGAVAGGGAGFIYDRLTHNR